MTDITIPDTFSIPPEVVEAAAMQLPGMAGFPHLVEAAIRAALNAWPGMEVRQMYSVWSDKHGIILPLPATENGDE